MQLGLDRSFFTIVCELNGCLYTLERDLTDMTPAAVEKDLRSGQFDNLHAILEFNPAEGWCNNVTEDFLLRLDSSPCPNAAQEMNWSDYRSERLDPQRAGVEARTAA